MKTLCVLVANSSHAKIFTVNGRGKEIKKIEEIDNPDSRKKGMDILTDRPGRTHDRFGEGRHAVGKDPLDREHELFAQKLSDLLKNAFDEGTLEELALIAPPEFLGEIRQKLPDSVKKLVAHEVDKDIASATDEKECIDLMCRYLDLWNR